MALIKRPPEGREYQPDSWRATFSQRRRLQYPTDAPVGPLATRSCPRCREDRASKITATKCLSCGNLF